MKSSYPTYEEWKQNDDERQKIVDMVLILPMRNGNFDYDVPIRYYILVLILPMRNGNSVSIFNFTISMKLVLILPMRNGNVKPDVKTLELIGLSSSYPTYEEWKLVLFLL